MYQSDWPELLLRLEPQVDNAADSNFSLFVKEFDVPAETRMSI
jgi:hypothetical protein